MLYCDVAKIPLRTTIHNSQFIIFFILFFILTRCDTAIYDFVCNALIVIDLCRWIGIDRSTLFTAEVNDKIVGIVFFFYI